METKQTKAIKNCFINGHQKQGTMSKKTTTQLLICLISLATFECESITSRGEEFFLPEDGKTDSFRNTTEHGSLLFGQNPNEGTLTENEFYHTWIFELTDNAQVTVIVDSLDPLFDTVLYLYRFDEEKQKWGRYIKRNDNFGDSLLSKLDVFLEAAKYRVLVKGYHSDLRGDFTVWAECSGPGCPDSCSLTEIGLISDLDKTVIPPHDFGGELPEKPYEGVTVLYNEIEFQNEGTAGDVYYVTARTPEFIDGISEWLETHGIPQGPIETGISGIAWIAREEKVKDISKILDQTSCQSFVLFGDTNHQDPEVFQDIMKAYPNRILASVMHNINDCDDQERLEGLLVHHNYAEAAAMLFGKGVLGEESARTVMLSAQQEGLEITDEEIEQLLRQYSP